MKKNKLTRVVLFSLMIFVSVPVILFVLMLLFSTLIVPETENIIIPERKIVAENFYTLGNNWLRKSKNGLWEMYIEGPAYQRGVIAGKLSKELIYEQENAFVKEIHKMIPSDFYLHFLKYLVRFFNRNLDSAIPDEYLREIYGISQSASEEFDFIGCRYERMLNYHAAHDVGHALQEYNLVGCSSFGAWGSKSSDSNLIIGRNFDFYVGDDFAKNKLVLFCNPDKGYKFISISWASMVGCMSGMNEKGITVTINAAKSVVPRKAATPISIIVREILQYAANIEEAYKIAQSREAFVSEIIMIGSLADNKVALIEKTPEKTELYFPDSNYLVCSNHFQSAAFKNDVMNLNNIKETSSGYRFIKLEELLKSYPVIDYQAAAEILRNQQGIGGTDIGFSNEKCINQLICHHSVIFKPAEGRIWVSTAPYQLGSYVCYNMNEIFNLKKLPDKEIIEQQLTIRPDTFISSKLYHNFLRYKYLGNYLKSATEENGNLKWNQGAIDNFIATNPSYYLVYSMVADYLKKNNDIAAAKKYYSIALTKEIPLKSETDRIIKSMESLKE